MHKQQDTLIASHVRQASAQAKLAPEDGGQYRGDLNHRGESPRWAGRPLPRRRAGSFVGDDGRRLRRDGADELKLTESEGLAGFAVARRSEYMKASFTWGLDAATVRGRKGGDVAGQALCGKSRIIGKLASWLDPKRGSGSTVQHTNTECGIMNAGGSTRSAAEARRTPRQKET